MRKELEDISFMYLFPEEYNRIKSLSNRGREEREKYIETVKGFITKKLNENKLKCEVLGRYKHYYSIYQKMIVQELDFEDIYDIIAFRIILETIPQCYEALGLIHSLWKPIPKKFKDYIGVPKPNMYQSLHTTVIGPFGERIEIQMRTIEMDRVAKSGIAAHWSYKEGKKPDPEKSRSYAWIQKLIENHENIKDPNEFMENVRIDLFPDDVYVYTPTGEIKSLPRGATPVDFAYRIHTEVGNQCVGAKINGVMVPLKYELKTGDIVEITTAKNHHPSKDWLKFVKTVKARSKIRQWIKIQEKDRSLTLGREMCEKAFRKSQLNFNSLIKSEEMDSVVKQFGYKTIDDLVVNVGYGKVTPLQIIRKFFPKPDPEEKQESFLDKMIGRVKKKKHPSGVIVQGADDILIKFGKCCQPVPGDNITGYITRGYGVTIHRANCVNALTMSPERQIDVEWNTEGAESYPAKIHVHSSDRMGLLADIVGGISQFNANIIKAETKTHENSIVDSFFVITVTDTDQLDKVISAVKKIKHVHDVKRILT